MGEKGKVVLREGMGRENASVLMDKSRKVTRWMGWMYFFCLLLDPSRSSLHVS